MPDGTIADIAKLEAVRTIGTLVAHGSDQPDMSAVREREDGEKIGIVEIDMQFAVRCRTGGVDISDIEQLPVGPTGEAAADDVADARAGAVAADDIACFAVLLIAIRTAQACQNAVAAIDEIQQLGLAFDLDTQLRQPLDQQSLML